MLDASWENRGRDMDEYIDVMLRAWRGEVFEWRGRRVEITPLPVSRPHPFISVGGQGRNAARRAARFGLPFQPSLHDPEVFALYESECERLGHKPILLPPGSGETIWVSEDPDRTWAEIGPYVLHHVVTYAGWQAANIGSVVNTDASTVEAIRAEGKYRVLTPEDCLAYAEEAEEKGERAAFHFPPLVGGTPPEVGWKSLRLFVEKVMPYL
jgi:alkanesulfonate monooxygenase SsuD/methylene tetrahydromethanopterin reductase-like flavin-dependent oxidoreductase (luciferase family)